MAKQFSELSEDLSRFIAEQPLFFVATAAASGRVNVSPKGMDSLRVLDANRIIWLNATGSGNETAGHLEQVNRMTLMWCSFSKRPLILRCYGSANVLQNGAAGWDELAAQLPDLPGARQIFDMKVDLVQTSCGYAVPFMQFETERETLRSWAEQKGEEGLRDYWNERNKTTIDGFNASTPR